MPSSTPLTNENPIWREGIQAAYMETSELEWSPVANEFVLNTCGGEIFQPDLNGDIFIATPPNFEPLNISPIVEICVHLSASDTIWTPDGQRIFFGGPYSDDSTAIFPYEFARIWMMDRDGRNAHSFEDIPEVRWLGFPGWMDEHTLVYSGYAGGGHTYLALLDVPSGRSYASTIVYSSGVLSINNDFIGMRYGTDPSFDISAAVISRAAADLHNSEADYDPFANANELSRDFNSRYEDWLSGTNNMLVLTWEKDIELWNVDLLHDSAVTQLQLWNVDTGDLTLLVAEAIRGQFSPDGRFLAYVTPGTPTPSIHLLPEMGHGPIFSLPLAAKRVGESSAEYNFYFSFAPNGRYFTFLTPGAIQVDADGRSINVDYQPENIHVNLFDLDTQQIIVSLPAQEFVPVWSPDNGRFFYQDAFGTLALYTLADNTAFPLTQAPDARLTNPHWSFDGSYLSVKIDWDKTAVLSIP
jgi:hypothetical protein